MCFIAIYVNRATNINLLIAMAFGNSVVLCSEDCRLREKRRRRITYFGFISIEYQAFQIVILAKNPSKSSDAWLDIKCQST